MLLLPATHLETRKYLTHEHHMLLTRLVCGFAVVGGSRFDFIFLFRSTSPVVFYYQQSLEYYLFNRRTDLVMFSVQKVYIYVSTLAFS